jgi:hypothetical protein
MKLRIFIILLLCILLSGCRRSGTKPEQTTVPAPVETKIEKTTAVAVIRPLPDTTMNSLDNSLLNISFMQNDFYQDESGEMKLRMQIYSYEKFDLVDISDLKAGDTIILSGEEILVKFVERNDYGTVLINGGLDEGGFDLATDDSGIYFVHGYSDVKAWMPVADAEFVVSETFVFHDSANLELDTVVYDAEDLVNGVPESIFGYQPQNTTVRIENGQVVEMNRIYTP